MDVYDFKTYLKGIAKEPADFQIFAEMPAGLVRITSEVAYVLTDVPCEDVMKLSEQLVCCNSDAPDQPRHEQSNRHGNSKTPSDSIETPDFIYIYN